MEYFYYNFEEGMKKIDIEEYNNLLSKGGVEEWWAFGRHTLVPAGTFDRLYGLKESEVDEI